MSRYHTIIENDISNGSKFHVSFWVQGCPHRCKGCFNPETWDFTTGALYTPDTKKQIIKAINANGIQRNLSILGGEPLAEQNLPMIVDLLKTVKETYPTIEVFLWTGYYIEQLNKSHPDIESVLSNVDYLIDGPFIEEKKDLSLLLRGSTNQRIWYHKEPNLWEKFKENSFSLK